jgi:hypothetical protein
LDVPQKLCDIGIGSLELARDPQVTLSWKRDADVPGDLQIIATPKAMPKMHWNMPGDYQVLLRAEPRTKATRVRHGSSSTTWWACTSSPTDTESGPSQSGNGKHSWGLEKSLLQQWEGL